MAVMLPLRCGPARLRGDLEDFPGPGEVFLNVPWFFDPGMPSFASPWRLGGVALDQSDSLGTSELKLDFGAQ